MEIFGTFCLLHTFQYFFYLSGTKEGEGKVWQDSSRSEEVGWWMELFSLFPSSTIPALSPVHPNQPCHPGLIQCLKYHPDNPIIWPGVPRVQCVWVRLSHLSSSPESNLLIHFYPPTVTSPPYPAGGNFHCFMPFRECKSSSVQLILIKLMFWPSGAKPPKYLTICPTVCHGQSSPVFAQNLWQVSPNLIFLSTKGGP